MKRKSPVMAVALAGLFMYTSCSPTEQAETKDYTQYVNTFIGAADNGAEVVGVGLHRQAVHAHDSLNRFLRNVLQFGRNRFISLERKGTLPS